MSALRLNGVTGDRATCGNNDRTNMKVAAAGLMENTRLIL